MKKVIVCLLLAAVLLTAAACTKKENIEFNSEALIDISYKNVGITDAYLSYTLHAVINNDGTVKVYVDELGMALSDEPYEPVISSVTPDELEQLKGIIKEEKAYEMRENVGKREGNTGTVKYFTIYSSNGEHTSGGLNPSNLSFLKVYDFAYGLVMEECISYSKQVDDNQIKLYAGRSGIGPRICDKNDNVIIDPGMIKEFFAESYVNEPSASDTGNAQDITADDESAEESSDMYKVVISLTPEGSEKIKKLTEELGACDDNPAIFYMYNNDTFCGIITLYAPVCDGVLYLNETYNEEKATAMVDSLELYMNKWLKYAN